MPRNVCLMFCGIFFSFPFHKYSFVNGHLKDPFYRRFLCISYKLFSLESTSVYGKPIVNGAMCFFLLHVVCPFLCLCWDPCFWRLCPEPGQAEQFCPTWYCLEVPCNLKAETMPFWHLCLCLLLWSISGELEILCRKKGSAGLSSFMFCLSRLAVK